MLAPDPPFGRMSGPPAPPDLPLAGVTVLLVEDSRLTSDVMRMFCTRSGARLRRAETLEQARRHLALYRPDVVIVDLGLPDGRGEVLIDTLARAGALVLGTSADPLGRQVAMEAGAAGFLEKPLRGIGAFQALLLAHLPPVTPARQRIGSGRAAGFMAGAELWRGGMAVDWGDDGAGAGADDSVTIDPLALSDDLVHAADALRELVAQGTDDATARNYLAGFISGIARATGDADLTALAEAARAAVHALPALVRAIDQRLLAARDL